MVKCLGLTLPIYAIESSIVSACVDEEVHSLYQHCQKDPVAAYSPMYYSGACQEGYIKGIMLESITATLASSTVFNKLPKRLAILRYARIHGAPKIDFERRALVQIPYEPPLFYLSAKSALYLVDSCLRPGLESMVSDHYSG